MRQAGKQWLFIIIGLSATGLAVAGAILPALPSTVFVLVALWAFSNASPRLHSWLLKIPILRPAIKEARRFQNEKNLPLSTKYISQGSAWASSVIVMILTQNITISLLCAAAAVACSICMYLIPTKQTKTASDHSDAV